MEEPGGLQSMGSLRVRHDWATSLSLFTFRHWRRKWQPTPAFLPGESQRRGSLVGCHLWGRTESDTTAYSNVPFPLPPMMHLVLLWILDHCSRYGSGLLLPVSPLLTQGLSWIRGSIKVFSINVPVRRGLLDSDELLLLLITQENPHKLRSLSCTKWTHTRYKKQESNTITFYFLICPPTISLVNKFTFPNSF